MLMIVNRCEFVTKLDVSGGKFSFEKFTPNQIGFSQIMISSNYAQPLPYSTHWLKLNVWNMV